MREAFSFIASLAAAPIALAAGVAVAIVTICLGFLAGRLSEKRTQRAKGSEPDALSLRDAEEARERAEAASEAKSRLLATMSHEIRTPLNGILGMAELLVATGLDLEQQSYVEAMRTSGQALGSLIETILDFSKIEAGKFELTHAPFDLVSLVEGVVELLAPHAQNAGLELACAIAPELPTRVLGDAARLRQVLINLVGNAVKYTLKGGVGLRVTAAGDMLQFAIIDTGPGIPAAHRAAIFEEFTVGAGDAPPAAGSTGLGLSIARRLADQMGGSLQLAETSARGSSFILTLPLPAIRDAQPLPIPSALKGKQALIVAASQFEAPYLAERLTAAGVELLWAANEEASQVFLRDAGRAGRPPHIVIVDCALGSAATRALGDAARAAGVAQRFVFFSPAERRAFGQNSLQSFDGWLIKPLRARSLYTRLAMTPDARPIPKPAEEPETKLAGLHVLFAEDNDINALIVRRHLEKRGATVCQVADGLAALQAAKDSLAGTRQNFDAIILDIRMPGIDGIEAARRIRLAEQMAGATACRILALSADAFDAAIEAARSAGIDEFLTKPVDLARLDRAVTAATKRDAVA
jgi:signal transduction histidine kinase/DNA-binding response OmpR family regulator